MRIVNTDSKRCPETHFVREKFTREQTAARKLAEEYFQPKNRYQTEVESWRHLQSANIEFTMKRLREPIEAGDNDEKARASLRVKHRRAGNGHSRTRSPCPAVANSSLSRTPLTTS
jgi:hypothetical protein